MKKVITFSMFAVCLFSTMSIVNFSFDLNEFLGIKGFKNKIRLYDVNDNAKLVQEITCKMGWGNESGDAVLCQLLIGKHRLDSFSEWYLYSTKGAGVYDVLSADGSVKDRIEVSSSSYNPIPGKEHSCYNWILARSKDEAYDINSKEDMKKFFEISELVVENEKQAEELTYLFFNKLLPGSSCNLILENYDSIWDVSEQLVTKNDYYIFKPMKPEKMNMMTMTKYDEHKIFVALSNIPDNEDRKKKYTELIKPLEITMEKNKISVHFYLYNIEHGTLSEYKLNYRRDGGFKMNEKILEENYGPYFLADGYYHSPQLPCTCK